MKLNLLELTQDILSSLNGDEVNSIADTAESRQVAQIIRTAYFNIVSRANLTEHQQLFNLEASGDSAQPVLMYRPEHVTRIDWIKYDISETSDPDLTYVTILPTRQFLDMVDQFDPEATEVDSFVIGGNTFYYKDDKHPTYCTVLQDYYVVFDSYDSDFDSTLQASKTRCFGLITPVFTIEDTFIPDIDEQQFPLLLNEAKSLAFLELKQVAHDQAVLESRRQWRSLQRNKSLVKANDFDNLPNFARR